MSTKAKQKKRSASVKRKPRKVYGHSHLCVYLLLLGAVATIVIGSGLAWFLLLDIPNIRTVEDYRPQVATTVLDRHGKPVDAIYRQYRIITRLEDMPPLLPKAFVAAEDSRFWVHQGLDVWSILRAAINNLRSGRRSQGGSTITQQVTRSLMLSREKSYSRKITESILAYRLNKVLTRQEILFIYLNETYLGEGAYGVAAAARRYFGKSVKELTLAEIALLAGLPQAPSRYSPHKRPQAAKARQRYVLNRMAEDGIISSGAARAAYSTQLQYRPPQHSKQVAGYFTDHVRTLLRRTYGREALYGKGLTVVTTLDSDMQENAVKAISAGVSAIVTRQGDPPPQGALVAMNAQTGRVRALVGGTNFQESPFNRATNAKRQPGSVFKPFVYAAAFEQGRRPNDTITDAPLTIRNRDGSVWSPKNYANRYAGPTTLTEGFIHSRNIVAIKLLQQTGLQPVVRLARNAGINAPLEPDLTLALGSSPLSLLEATSAYTMFANQGRSIEPVFITSIRDHNGRRQGWPQSRPRPVLSAETAATMHRLLTLAVQRGTGKKASTIAHAAGKTGTTDHNTDAWFIGYSGRLLTGVWLGHDRNRPLGRSETGGNSAAPVWTTFMKHAQPR